MLQLTLLKRIMKHSFPILVILVVCNFIVLAQNGLVLKDVSVDTITLQQIKLKWHYKDIDSVSIYRCVNQCDNENFYNRVAKIKMDMNCLEWIDNDANPTSHNYYSIGWSNSGKSAPLNNMVLNVNKSNDGCINSVLLSWNPYINMPDSIDHYKILFRTNTDSVFTIRDSIKGEHFTGFYFSPANKIRYNARFLKNNNIYEFVIQAVNKTNTEYSFSNIVKYEITGVEDTAAVSIDISCVSVTENNSIQIDVSTDDYIFPFQKLYLYRDESNPPVKPEEMLQFKRIDSLNYESSNSYQFTDKNVDPNTKLYYYKVIAENLCRFNDTSNVKSNIFLTGNRVEKYKDIVQFTQAEFPESDSNSFELCRLVYNKLKQINELSINTTYICDVTPFMDDGAAVQYQIKSAQGCLSNILRIDHEPVIEFPDAFYPQSKHIENQTFYPILKFLSETESNYLFVIYDRWGQEVFRTAKPPEYCFSENISKVEKASCVQKNKEEHCSWDGTFQGRECPPGIYAYKISFRYQEGKNKYSDSGTFMLVR